MKDICPFALDFWYGKGRSFQKDLLIPQKIDKILHGSYYINIII